MENLIVKGIVVGMIGTNCYLAIHRKTGEAVIIDPGDEAERIARLVTQEQCSPTAILLTHGHFDHVLAAETLSVKYDIPIYIHEMEKATLEEPELNGGYMAGIHQSFHIPAHYVKEGDTLALAGFSFRVILTPGHTPGGVCYYLESEGALFSGDTLFAGSVGRTDFPKGSMRELVTGIREKLLVLPGETVVYPGHMGTTTIDDEKRYNMFL